MRPLSSYNATARFSVGKYQGIVYVPPAGAASQEASGVVDYGRYELLITFGNIATTGQFVQEAKEVTQQLGPVYANVAAP